MIALLALGFGRFPLVNSGVPVASFDRGTEDSTDAKERLEEGRKRKAKDKKDQLKQRAISKEVRSTYSVSYFMRDQKRTEQTRDKVRTALTSPQKTDVRPLTVGSGL